MAGDSATGSYMPRISQFYGIAVYIYYRVHAPPHFHAIYAEHEAEIEIASAAILQGKLPRKARGLVRECAEAHRTQLLRDWNLAREGQPLEPIEPLE
jgi:hypothetical protein